MRVHSRTSDSDPFDFLHRRLLRGLLFLAFLTGGLILSFVSLRTSRVREELAKGRVERRREEVARQVESYFRPVEGSLAIIRRWAAAGKLDLDDTAGLNHAFIPFLQEIPHVSTLVVAREDGAEYRLLRLKDGWETRIALGEKQYRFQRWKDPDTPLGQAEERREEYDPRERPWYQGATAAGDTCRLHWTAPYRFFSTQEPGITAAACARTREDPERGQPSRLFVVALDVHLAELSDFTTEIVVGENGMAFLVTEDLRIIGLPRHERFREPSARKAALLCTEKELALPHLSHVVHAFDEVKAPRADVFRFSIDNVAWWGGAQPISIGDLPVWIGVAVPEADLSAEVDHKKYAVLIGGILALLLATGLAVHMAREYTRSARNAQEASLLRCSDEELAARIADGESTTLEFKSSLRWNLKADKADKQIELAWLKNVVAFLNTDGGAVLIGVGDDGELLDIELDQFANEDKYLLHVNNLLDRHVGTEFSAFVSFAIRRIKDRRLLVIECGKAAQPAFLKDGEQEDFYVRMGPAARKLATSQVVQYVQDRTA